MGSVGRMRQVGRAELIWKIITALRHVRRSTWKDLTDPRPQIRDRAMLSAATCAADGLDQLEILSGDPDAPDTTFTQPLARMAGEEVASGAPEIIER
jgi:hypothetical protein